MQLTQFTDYGLRTLMYLAGVKKERASVREIAAFYGVSYNHLVKVSHQLAKLGLINSVKGKNGGISLKHEALQQKIGDLVLALEPNMNIVECFNREENTCRITKDCQLKFVLKDATDSFIKELNKKTLADISAGPFRVHFVEQ